MKYRLMSWFVIGLLGISVGGSVQAAEAWKDLNNQVLQLYKAGTFGQALPVAERALQKAETEFGKNSPETALSLNNLALLYKTQGKYDEAIRLYEQSLAVAEKLAGPDDEDLLVPLNNLAALYESQGQKEKADEIYERIRAMGHAETADKMKNRARKK
jgi:tetratricopeptide (TPR) repeat protein